MKEKSLKNWWKEGFGEAIYPIDEIFKTPQWIKRTKTEIAFLKNKLSLSKKTKILDVCCGVGRHSIPLAQLGCSVTGLDISQKYLKIATERASELNLPAEFRLQDARKIKEPAIYDIGINLFSSLGYFLDVADDHKILKGIHQALKPGGQLILEIYNSSRLLHIFDFCQKHQWQTSVWTEATDQGLLVLAKPEVLKKKHAFMNHFIFVDKNGARKEMKTFNRIFTLPEMTKLLKANKFKITQVFGGLDGSKYDPVLSENMVLFAKKTN